MNWITREQVCDAAEKGELAALNCSIEHWKQLATADYGECIRAYEANEVNMVSNRCALCELQELNYESRKPDACLFNPSCRYLQRGCALEYNDAVDKFWGEGMSIEDFEIFQEKAEIVMKKLIEIRDGMFE